MYSSVLQGSAVLNWTWNETLGLSIETDWRKLRPCPRNWRRVSKKKLHPEKRLFPHLKTQIDEPEEQRRNRKYPEQLEGALSESSTAILQRY